MIRVNENTALLGGRIAQAALESPLFARKWTEKSHGPLLVRRRQRLEDRRETMGESEDVGGGMGVKVKGWN